MSTPVAGADWFRRQFSAVLLIVDRTVELHPWQVMGAILFIYLGRAAYFSHTRELQIDELLTYTDTQLPSLSSLWWTLKHYPPALDPPLHPFLAYFAYRLPINFPLSYRLPSIVAYGASMLSIFVLLRKRVPAAVALTAAVVPMLVPVFDFAIEARPYALTLGFAGWAFVCWQRATECRTKRTGALLGLYLCLAGVLLSHFLGGLVYIPLLAGELWHSYRSGIDYAVWAVFAVAGITIVTYIPLLPAASLYRVNPWHGVLIEDLWQTYLLGISPTLLIALSLCALCWQFSQKLTLAEKAVAIRSHELVAITGLYFIPVISYVIAVFATHSYVPRYALMFSIAQAIALAMVIYRMINRALTSVVMLILIICAGQSAVLEMINRPSQNTGGISDTRLPVLDSLPGLPIVEPSWHDYMRLSLFGPEELKKRMILVLDPEDVKQHTNFALSTEAVHRALHLPKESYEQMIHSHPQFLLLEGSRLREQLIEDGREVRLVGRVFRRDLYLVRARGTS